MHIIEHHQDRHNLPLAQCIDGWPSASLDLIQGNELHIEFVSQSFRVWS